MTSQNNCQQENDLKPIIRDAELKDNHNVRHMKIYESFATDAFLQNGLFKVATTTYVENIKYV